MPMREETIPESGDTLLTTAEVAKKLRCSETTLRSWRRESKHEKKLKGPRWTMVGVKVFYERAEVEAYQQANKVNFE